MSTIGRTVLDLRPTKDNPRNSEGAVYRFPDGRLMFVWSKFIGETNNDDAHACIAARYSSDGGETWTDERILFRPEQFGAKNIMSVSLLPMRNGDIGLFFIIRMSNMDTREHLWRSSDGGTTWKGPTVCIPKTGYYVTNNDRVIRLSTGRILIPCSLHRNSDTTFDSRGVPCVFCSDDDGYNWKEYPCSWASIPHSASGLQEPGVIELSDGVLWMWMRTDALCQYEAFSRNGGESWTAVQPSRFSAPCSPLSMKRLPNGKLLAVWNPIPNYNGRAQTKAGWGRTPLVLAVSADEGDTWSNPVAVEDDPEHGYCYTAIHFEDDAIFLVYCSGGPEDAICLARLTMKKISYDELP